MARVNISVDDETLRWVEQEVEKKRFRNVSHGFEYAVNELVKKED